MVLPGTRASLRLFACIAVCLGTIPVPASRSTVEVAADERADFAAYETFAVEIATPPRSERATREVEAAVTAGVAKRGLRLVESDPDLRVRIHVLVGAHTLAELSDESRWEFWTGVRDVSAYELGEGTLLVDFVDTVNGHTVWRGLTTDRITGSAQSNYNRLPKIVGRLLKSYPKRQ